MTKNNIIFEFSDLELVCKKFSELFSAKICPKIRIQSRSVFFSHLSYYGKWFNNLFGPKWIRVGGQLMNMGYEYGWSPKLFLWIWSYEYGRSPKFFLWIWGYEYEFLPKIHFSFPKIHFFSGTWIIFTFFPLTSPWGNLDLELFSLFFLSHLLGKSGLRIIFTFPLSHLPEEIWT